ncbi:MAG: YdjY domain-containing protein [Verrucomicrobiales bacterium]
MKTSAAVLLSLLLPLVAQEGPKSKAADLAAQGEEKNDPQNAPKAPPIQQLNEHEFQVGKVRIDKRSRAISFPGAINMNKGLLEYGIVHLNGKIHEALVVTDISPFNLNIAFKLLRYPASDELFEIVDEKFNPTGKFPEPAPEVRQGARIDIALTWQADGRENRRLMNELVYHTTLERPMPPGPWLYTGSYMLENRYKAEVSGDISAIFLAQPAMINYPGEDRVNDDVWIVNEKHCPPVDTPVTVTITPHQSPQHKENQENPDQQPEPTTNKKP